MKKVIAYLSLLLFVGCAGSVLLKTYIEENSNNNSVENNKANYFFVNSADSSTTSSQDEFSDSDFRRLDAIATFIGKVKLPTASSSPVITSTFSTSFFQFLRNSALSDPAQLHTQPAPIFLQNCVFRL